jgi:hypothetical protein
MQKITRSHRYRLAGKSSETTTTMCPLKATPRSPTSHHQFTSSHATVSWWRWLMCNKSRYSFNLQLIHSRIFSSILSSSFSLSPSAFSTSDLSLIFRPCISNPHLLTVASAHHCASIKNSPVHAITPSTVEKLLAHLLIHSSSHPSPASISRHIALWSTFHRGITGFLNPASKGTRMFISAKVTRDRAVVCVSV